MACLPRDLPIVLPLGGPYPQSTLVKALAYPERVAILPTIPYGWEGSRLPIHPDVLAALVRNLAGSLHEDGFINVLLQLPARVKLGLDMPVVTCPPELEIAVLEAPTWDPARVVLIPVGHVEQHGYHLPLSTETVIIGAISRACADAVPHLALSLPVMPYGVSTHRRVFPGTFNVEGRVFEDF